MIEGADKFYQQIADEIALSISEPWVLAKIEAVFHPGNSEYLGDYFLPSGQAMGFEVTLPAIRAFRELRRKFKGSGQSVWGQATFELEASGKFKMAWGYENCDENGDTIWNEDEWKRRHQERERRLGFQ
ncbi:MAG: immunity protein YezG family protein [Planctomycetia bacterium]